MNFQISNTIAIKCHQSTKAPKITKQNNLVFFGVFRDLVAKHISESTLNFQILKFARFYFTVLVIMLASFNLFSQTLNNRTDLCDYTSYYYTHSFHSPVEVNFLKTYFVPQVKKYVPRNNQNVPTDIDYTSFYYSLDDFDELVSNDINFINYEGKYKIKNYSNVDYNVTKYNYKKVDFTTYYYVNSKKHHTDTSIHFYNIALIEKDTLKNYFSDTSIVAFDKKQHVHKAFKNYGFTRDWVLLIIIVNLLIFAFVKFYYSDYLSKFYSSIFNYTAFTKLFRERNSLRQRASSIYYIVFYINLSLFIYFIINYYNLIHFKFHPFTMYLIIIAGVFLVSYNKTLMLKSLGFFLDLKNITNEYIFSLSIYNQATGIIFFPIVLSLPYIPQAFVSILIVISISLLLIFFLLRIFRAFRIIFEKHYSYFYLILYLCALEILPYFLVWKLFNILT